VKVIAMNIAATPVQSSYFAITTNA